MMEKFSKVVNKKESIKKKKDEVLYKNDYVNVIDYEDWTIVKERDCILCIPYLIEQNQFILRQEYIPTYKYVDGQELHLTVLSGTIEDNESPEECLLREIQEEAGLVLREDINIIFGKPLFFSKGNTAKCYPCILLLDERAYHEILIKGDGSRSEKLSKSLKIDIKYLSALNPSDIPTEYMLNMLRKELNII